MHPHDHLKEHLFLVTDAGRIDLPSEVTSCTVPSAAVTLTYETCKNAPFVKRVLSVTFEKKTILYTVGMEISADADIFLYHTFYNASAAAFGRNGSTGFCFGFENPYVEWDGRTLSFAPSLILEAGETYVCDANFFGAYELSGELIRPEYSRTPMKPNGRCVTRYRNPSEGIALDFSEIRFFSDYCAEYCELDKKGFRFCAYDFFSNLPERPETPEDQAAYLTHIDAFAKLGGDTIILNPLYPNEIPDYSKPDSVWDIAPEGTVGRRILEEARSRGFNVGLYTGTAGNGRYGNSSMIGCGTPDAWRKKDIEGNVSEENCLGSDAFVDWYIDAQKRTIEKYGLGVWDWDPGPGNGMFCFDESHGHLAGKGAYKGFRNGLKIMKALKDAFPNLYYLGFHGNKEYGVWGFKYIDQHEAYWENEPYVMTPLFPDLAMDRMTADGARMQGLWNYYFRFLSPTLNHGLAHRMAQVNWMQELELDTMVDFVGYRFALLSAIAMGGAVCLPITPRDPETVEGYLPFYHKWIGWARSHDAYNKHTIPFGSQATAAGVEGYAKLIGNDGWIFLINPSPAPLSAEIPFTARIGMEKTEEKYALAMVEPYANCDGKTYAYGDTAQITVPGYTVLVFRLTKADAVCADNETTVPALPRFLPAENSEAVFFADPAIKELLTDAAKQLNDDIRSLAIRFSKRFDRANYCWTMPDRLWLWLPFVDADRAENVRLFVNEKEVPLLVEEVRHNDFYAKTLYFADITDAVAWNAENRLRVSCGGEAPVGMYLHYPKKQNEVLPDAVFPPLFPPCTAPAEDGSVRILSACLNADNILRPRSENTLRVTANLPAEELEGVYASMPVSIGETGYDLKCDMPLEWDGTCWTKTFRSEERIHLIVDDDHLVFWAVTKDGRESPGFSLPIQWILD